MRILCLWAVLLGLLAGAAHADMLELDSCTDAQGRTVPGRADSALGVIVGAGEEGGQRVIRYNPDLLPQLSAAARQFFFAHECARVALGVPPGTRLAAARARAADCIGVATLQASGLLHDAVEVAALQAELVFSDEEWTRLPGPRRAFDLLACPQRAGIALPVATAPGPGQLEWDACIRRCGDRLYGCQGSCRGGACGECQAAYDRCQAACKSD